MESRAATATAAPTVPVIGALDDLHGVVEDEQEDGVIVVISRARRTASWASSALTRTGASR